MHTQKLARFSGQWLILLLVLLLTGLAQAEGLKAGVDYKRVEPAIELPETGKIQVVELFWYGCPACYNLEPHLERWLMSKPENVEFVRMPAIFNNPMWALHAQAYYTAEELGVVEDFHAPFFHAMHRFNKRLASEEEIRAFFQEIGVKAEDFSAAFNSFTVQTKVRRAADMTARYGINGVPSLAINGKYVVDGPMAKTYENMFQTVNTLAAQEAKQQGGK